MMSCMAVKPEQAPRAVRILLFLVVAVAVIMRLRASRRAAAVIAQP
jgi:hypothetical protein